VSGADAPDHDHQALSARIDISWPIDRQALSKLTDNRCPSSSTKPPVGTAGRGRVRGGWGHDRLDERRLVRLERAANALFPLLGVGAGLVVGFARSSLARGRREAGWLGRAARYLLAVARCC
jgi:hypothetical protein